MKQTLTIGFLTCLSWLWSDHKVVNNTNANLPGSYINPYGLISQGQSLLKEGDLVVRQNRDPFSRLIRMLNKHDKSYSHSGIVLYENGYPYVFHMVSGDENPGGKLRKDSLARFCDPRKNNAYGIYRYTMSDAEIRLLKATIHQWYQAGLKFDGEFNLQSDDRMYCSEMISKALARATDNRIQIQLTELTNIEAGLISAYTHHDISYTRQLGIVSIDNLYTNPNCRPVHQFIYTNSR